MDFTSLLQDLYTIQYFLIVFLIFVVHQHDGKKDECNENDTSSSRFDIRYEQSHSHDNDYRHSTVSEKQLHKKHRPSPSLIVVSDKLPIADDHSQEKMEHSSLSSVNKSEIEVTSRVSPIDTEYGEHRVSYRVSSTDRATKVSDHNNSSVLFLNL